MHGKLHSDDLVSVVYRLHDEGVSQSSIAKTLGISRCAVQGALKRRIPSTNTQQIVKRGPPRCTSKADDLAIVVSIKRNRFQSNSSIAGSFNVSHETIRRRANENGLPSRRAVRDPLKKHHKQARMMWCKHHRHTEFKNWIFSDESFFQLGDCSTPRHPLVHRKRHERYSDCCVSSDPISNRRGLMVWGCITQQGKGVLTFVEGNINSEKYITILQNNLIPFLESFPLSLYPNLVFQQDNATPHRSAITRDYLKKENISPPHWPALSPDLSPIENVWGIMKARIRRMKPTSMSALKDAILHTWEMTVNPSSCARLYASIPSRIHKVIIHRGRR
jgi:transposase